MWGKLPASALPRIANGNQCIGRGPRHDLNSRLTYVFLIYSDRDTEPHANGQLENHADATAFLSQTCRFALSCRVKSPSISWQRIAILDSVIPTL